LSTPTLAERINRLFATIHPPDRGPYTSTELVSTMKSRGAKLSKPYLTQLRRGTRKRPSAAVVAAITEFFGVRPTYLTDVDSHYYALLDRELTWLETSRDDTVRNLTTLILQLPPDAQDDVLGFADELRAVN
jgi:transcriptional regulator with XRE-family HTH domain